MPISLFLSQTKATTEAILTVGHIIEFEKQSNKKDSPHIGRTRDFLIFHNKFNNGVFL